jgi:hypothetical protein
MADESNLGVIPTARALRWGAFALLVLAAVFLYFRDGRRVPAFAAPAAHAADTTR